MRPTRDYSSFYDQGFTAIEVIVVVIILGILTTLAVPSMNAALVDTRLTSAREEVVAAIEFSQLSALSRGRPSRVSIDSSTETLLVEQRIHTGIATLLDDETSETSESVVETNVSYVPMDYPPSPGTSYSIDLSERSIDVTASDVGSGSPLHFSAQGVPSSSASITLAHGGRTSVITVDGLTGKVSFSG